MDTNTSVQLILKALTLGAKAIASKIGDEETTKLYYFIKNRIYEKWIGEPNPDNVITEYLQRSSSIAETVLSQKLQDSGVTEDRHFLSQCERLLDVLDDGNSQNISINQNIDAQRHNSSGDTAIGGGIVDKSTEQNFIENKQSKLAALFGLIAVALAAFVGLLYKSGTLYKIAPDVLPAPTCNANSNNDCLDNAEIRLVLSRDGGDPIMQGTAYNSGDLTIDRFHIGVVISNFYIEPKSLSNSKIVKVLDTVNNLKPGETRPVSGSLNLKSSWVEDIPKQFGDESFNYKLYWGDGFTTNYFKASTDKFQMCQDTRSCSKLFQ